MWILLPFAMVLGGLGRRVAGGGANQVFRPNGGRVMGDTPARLIFGCTIAAAALMAGAVWWHCLLLVPAVWVGTTIGNFESLAMGHGKYSYAHDFWGLTLHGIAGTAWAWVGAAALGYAASNFMLIGGLMIAPAYTLGWWLIPSPAGDSRYPVGLRGGQELGELFYGSLFALGAFLTVVMS